MGCGASAPVDQQPKTGNLSTKNVGPPSSTIPSTPSPVQDSMAAAAVSTNNGDTVAAAKEPVPAPEQTPAAATAAVLTNETTKRSESGSRSAWVPPASASQKEGVRFREKKTGFQGFRVIVSDDNQDVYDQGASKSGVKDPEDRVAARASLGNLLPMEDGEEFEMLFRAMREISKKAGDFVFEQGKKRPFFYLVVSGEFELDNVPSRYANEQVLLGSATGAGSFKCVADGRLWLIDLLSYQNARVNHAKIKAENAESLLSNIPALAPLPKEQREEIAQVLKPVAFKKGEYLMRQGEIGETIYFIEKGECSVIKGARSKTASLKDVTLPSSKDAPLIDGEEIARRKRGEYIGEGSLLTDEPRIADVVAATDVECMSLTRADFKELMGSLTELMHHNFCTRVLGNVEIFKNLPQGDLLTIATALETVTFTAGEYIVHQEEEGDFFYIIKEGTVECTIMETKDQEQPKRIGTLCEGEYFGEGALLTNNPRRANVVASKTGDSDKVVLWGLSRSNFQKCELSLDLLEQNFKKRKNDSDESRAQTKWDELENIRVLGSGSYGTVTLVRHRVTGETFALKRIRKATVVAKKQQRFVKNERELLSNAHSPFIVNLVRTFNKGDSVYMLTEVCLGGELYTLMKDTVDSKPWDEADDDDYGACGCFEIGTQCRFFTSCVVLAIEALHAQGIIHRDIKPENLLLDDRGYLKLADFGFAKLVGDHRQCVRVGALLYFHEFIVTQEGATWALAHTRPLSHTSLHPGTYSLCGTPEYTAPEVYKRCGHSKGVDWWALGVILYEMASGFSPFHVLSQNSWDCYIEVSKYEKFYPNIQFPHNFGDELCNLLPVIVKLRLMHPNPTKRYGTRKSNAKQVKLHPFFGTHKEYGAKLDWSAISERSRLLASCGAPSEGLNLRPRCMRATSKCATTGTPVAHHVCCGDGRGAASATRL